MSDLPAASVPITVLIPVYNEELILNQNIHLLKHYLETNWPEYEILIACNGSTDNSAAIARKLSEAHSRINCFELPRKGVGSAFSEGVRRAVHDRIVTVDADLTTDMDFIPRAAKFLDDYDIVIGSKKIGRQTRSLIRIAGSSGFILCVRSLLGLPFGDYSIGAKAYRRTAIGSYLARINHGSSYVIEIIYHARRRGFSIVEIPVFCKDTRGSKFNLAHEGMYRFFHLFKLWIHIKL